MTTGQSDMEKPTGAAGKESGTSTISRRQLLKLGAGAAPVLMALTSRSAFACHSTTPSAFGSVCASRPDSLKALSGQPPSYWKSNCDAGDWPSPYYPKTSGSKTATKFVTVFGSSGNPYTSTTTLLAVLTDTSTDNKKKVARSCVAALLNAASGRTSSVLPVGEVVTMWKEFASKTYYEPTTGIKWYANTPTLPPNGIANTGGNGGILGYLNTTWT